MSVLTRLKIDRLRSLAFGSIVANYTAIGTRFEFPTRMVIIQNFTDADLMFSATGNTDHIPIRANSSMVLDGTANKTTDTGFFFIAGTTFHVKRIETPTKGTVYITAIYGD